MRRSGKQINLSDALGNVVGGFSDAGARILQVKVRSVWEEVAGRTVTEHTTGAHLRAGELVVSVDSAVWATELSALAGHYIEAMNRELGKESVTSVRFTVSPQVSRERALKEQEVSELDSYREDVVDPVALTEQERAQVEASAEAIEDAELREAVVRATIADLEWKKGLAARKSAQEPREGR